MPKAATFAEKLRQVRDEKGLSQNDLATMSGVKVKAIRSYEQELRTPSAEALFSLSNALGVDCTTFKGCRFTKEKQSSQQAKGK